MRNSGGASTPIACAARLLVRGGKAGVVTRREAGGASGERRRASHSARRQSGWQPRPMRCGQAGALVTTSRWQLLLGMLARTAGAVTPETADRQAAPNDCDRPQYRYRRKDYALSSSGSCSLRRFCRQECWHYSTVNARRRYHSKVAITWSAIAHFWSAKRQHPTPRVLMLRVEFVMWTLSSLGAQT